MFDFYIGKNGNMVEDSSESNAFSMTDSTADYLTQKAQIVLKAFLNEWYLDSTVGMPYWDMVDKGPSLKVLQAAMKDALLDIDGVSEISSFSMSYSGSSRQLTVKFTLKAEDGETVEGTV